MMDSEEVGQHWIIVLFSRPKRLIISLDSLRRSNWALAQALVKFLCKGFHSHEANMIEAQCQQQRNSFDCGVFVMEHAELIARNFVVHRTIRSLPNLYVEATAKRAKCCFLSKKFPNTSAAPSQSQLIKKKSLWSRGSLKTDTSLLINTLVN